MPVKFIRRKNPRINIDHKKIDNKYLHLRFRHELLNNFDGTFVFRLRILVACKQLQIHFLSPQNETLCGGPFIIGEPFFGFAASPFL